MNIEKFIEESLKQICSGIRSAKTDIKPNNKVNTDSVIASGGQYDIHFDLAVVVSEDETIKASGGVNIKIAKGGVDKENHLKTENTHRISFDVPIFPGYL